MGSLSLDASLTLLSICSLPFHSSIKRFRVDIPFCLKCSSQLDIMSSPMPSPIRLSPQISNLQQNSPYLDIYTNAPISPLRTQENTQHLRQTLPLSHPEPKRWESPGAWGARHINDSAPFTLWDEVNRKFHHPTREQSAWIRRKFGDGTLSHNGWLMRIETASPPQPIPFTLGAMPVLFVPPGGPFEEPIPSAPYPNPRLPDPCPGVHWPRMVNPTKSQRTLFLRLFRNLLTYGLPFFFRSGQSSSLRQEMAAATQNSHYPVPWEAEQHSITTRISPSSKACGVFPALGSFSHPRHPPLVLQYMIPQTTSDDRL